VILWFVLAVATTPGCNNPRSQADMNRCAAIEFDQADAAMTRQWRMTLMFMRDLDARNTSHGGGFGYASALLESQRAWLKYRDAQCVIEGGQFAGGSAGSMARTRCAARLTSERQSQLRKLVWQR
jgi:uncharacterized protein YecT (DUF1311 family)